MIRFELCANGYQSLVNGMLGGARCAELCEALEVGGVTPSNGTLSCCRQAISRHSGDFSVRVLIRCRPGNYIYNDEEIDIMCEDIKLVKSLGYEGVVIGALNEKGDLDIKAVKKMMAVGSGLKFTFHRAIDACNNPLETLDILTKMGFDKVLTSGGKPTAYEGMEFIKKMNDQYGDRINIMAGGGINEKNIIEIIQKTGVKNCHASLTSFAEDYHQELYPNGVDKTGADMRCRVSELDKIVLIAKLLDFSL